MDPIPRTIQHYVAADLTDPFRRWLLRRIDENIRAIVRTRLRRIEEHGNYGDCEPVGSGIFELRIRVYFGIDGGMVILLAGGTKSTQISDIEKAKERWSDYNA